MLAGVSQSVEVFDVLLKGPVTDYLNCSRAIGSEVEKHVSDTSAHSEDNITNISLIETHSDLVSAYLTLFLANLLILLATTWPL